jgi:protein-S-isoprenylcysteine O-methyltransferase Ste14
MDPIGKSPIPVPVLILGKAAMGFCLLFFAVKTQIADALLYDSVFTQILGVLLAAGGLLLVILGFVFLGRSVSVGLPGEETELKTQGIFRITRNPLYLGGFLACAGSCLYSLHIVNILLCALTVWIHHSIVLKEEKFLEERFGQRWLDYKRRVPRYLGKPST